MDRSRSAVTPQRFAQGRTFQEYAEYVGTPESLQREGSQGARRQDFSGFLREAYDSTELTPQQVEAIRWLAGQPGGPAKVLVISEEWSSDCRRDVPTLAKLADAGGLELRIFTRDGQKFGAGSRPDPAAGGNADIVAEFLNEKNGEIYQSIPVAVFYDKDMNYLYHYVEYPAIYHKDRVAGYIRSKHAGETDEQFKERSNREFNALQRSPFFKIWACAGVDEILSALHERLTVPASF